MHVETGICIDICLQLSFENKIGMPGAAENLPVSDQRANVLLVDDEPDNLLVLEAVLADLDVNLLILLDIGMPRLNGYEAARRIREQPWGRQMVLAALTGWGQAEDKRQAEEAGFDHHLTKPMDLRVLEKLLDGLLKKGDRRLPTT